MVPLLNRCRRAETIIDAGLVLLAGGWWLRVWYWRAAADIVGFCWCVKCNTTTTTKNLSHFKHVEALKE